MAYEEFLNNYLLDIPEKEALWYILLLFDSYKKEKDLNILYSNENDIPENIISLYFYFILKRNFKIIFGKYKRKFINNESIVEPGVTKEEKKGLGLIYDYICRYPNDKVINIYQEAMNIHMLLYSECPYPEFGKELRKDSVCLYDTPYDVLSGYEVLQIFAKYSLVNISFSDDENIFDYIDNCIKLCVDLIALQPFRDGNKRTFRALLNLLLKQANIPPIYIQKEERDVYKRDLIKAICDKDYTDICKFYHYKIADAIVGVAISPYDKISTRYAQKKRSLKNSSPKKRPDIDK